MQIKVTPTLSLLINNNKKYMALLKLETKAPIQFFSFDFDY